jgi:hypothetical protein
MLCYWASSTPCFATKSQHHQVVRFNACCLVVASALLLLTLVVRARDFESEVRVSTLLGFQYFKIASFASLGRVHARRRASLADRLLAARQQ